MTELFPPESVASQPLLFDVPKNRKKLDVWKEKHEVKSWHEPDWETPWVCIQPKLMEKLYGCYGARADMHLAEMAMHIGRLITDGEYMGEGHSEEEACYWLAKQRGLPFLESITQEELKA